MTTAETMKLIGKHATIYIGGLNIEVTVSDVKTSYGKLRYLVTPFSGTGSIWVESIQNLEGATNE